MGVTDSMDIGLLIQQLEKVFLYAPLNLVQKYLNKILLKKKQQKT